MKYKEYPQWFFAWSTGKPYITSICDWDKKGVILQVEKFMGKPWKRIYAQGGRAIKCKVIS